jgi:hypothetical protein
MKPSFPGQESERKCAEPIPGHNASAENKDSPPLLESLPALDFKNFPGI